MTVRRARGSAGAACALLALLAGAGTAQDEGDDLFDDLDALLSGEELVIDDAGDDAGARGSASPSSWLRTWKGFVELEPRVYLADRGGEKEDEQLLIEGELELDFRFGEKLTGYARPRVFVDALDTELRRFEPYEAYVTYEGDAWDFRAGQFVENWGIVDTYNPLDVLNRRDFATDPLDADRLGELGLRLRKTFQGGDTVGEPTVSLYALPLFRPTRFGTDEQRLGFGTEALPFDEDAGFEPRGSDEAFYAARFQSTVDTRFANADVQLVAARGPARTPTLIEEAGTLLPVYYGATTVGGGLRAVPNESAAGSFLSSLTLKAEVVRTEPFSFDASPVATPEPFTAYVVGLDRSFYGLFSDQDELLTTIEYAGEAGGDDPAGLLRPFRNDLIVRALYEVNDFARQSLEVRALFDLDIDESIYEVIYERQLRAIHEDLKWIVQAQVFDAADPGQSFFGFLEDLTSVSVGLRLDF